MTAIWRETFNILYIKYYRLSKYRPSLKLVMRAADHYVMFLNTVRARVRTWVRACVRVCVCFFLKYVHKTAVFVSTSFAAHQYCHLFQSHKRGRYSDWLRVQRARIRSSSSGREKSSVVVKALCYKPEGRGFDTRWSDFLNLPNPFGRTRPWVLLSL
jgi:hypothetical protein